LSTFGIRGQTFHPPADNHGGDSNREGNLNSTNNNNGHRFHKKKTTLEVLVTNTESSSMTLKSRLIRTEAAARFDERRRRGCRAKRRFDRVRLPSGRLGSLRAGAAQLGSLK